MLYQTKIAEVTKIFVKHKMRVLLQVIFSGEHWFVRVPAILFEKIILLWNLFLIIEGEIV